MNSHHEFLTEGSYCRKCGTHFDEVGVDDTCHHDPGMLTAPEIGAAIAVLVATFAVTTFLLVIAEEIETTKDFPLDNNTETR